MRRIEPSFLPGRRERTLRKEASSLPRVRVNVVNSRFLFPCVRVNVDNARSLPPCGPWLRVRLLIVLPDICAEGEG